MAFNFLGAVLVGVGSGVLSYALQRPPQDAKNNGIQGTPTAEDGKSIQWVFGKFHARDINCLWYGDLSTHEIKANGGK